MIARDCWNLEPPMPASAINWLTALITWSRKRSVSHGGHNSQNTQCWNYILNHTDLQMWADYRLALCELKVFPHEKVQQCSCLRLGGAGTMVTALEDLVAKTAAQVSLTLEECIGELEGETRRWNHTWERRRNYLHLDVTGVREVCQTFCTKSLSDAKTCRRVVVDWLIWKKSK